MSKLDHKPFINAQKTAELSKSTVDVSSCEKAIKPIILAKDQVQLPQHQTQLMQAEMDNFQTVSKCSNYDTVAMPIGEQHRNPFK